MVSVGTGQKPQNSLLMTQLILFRQGDSSVLVFEVSFNDMYIILCTDYISGHVLGKSDPLG